MKQRGDFPGIRSRSRPQNLKDYFERQCLGVDCQKVFWVRKQHPFIRFCAKCARKNSRLGQVRLVDRKKEV